MAAISKSRPVDKQLLDPATGRVTVGWDDFFNKTQSATSTDTVQSVTATASTVIDLNNGSVIQLALDATISSLVFTNPPAAGMLGRVVLIITNGGSFGITTWPTGTRWVSGYAPVITTGTGKVDVIVLLTPDAGTTWLGFISGQDLS
jgi:hypothetical protein